MTAPRARKSGSFTSETRAACSRFDLGPAAAGPSSSDGALVGPAARCGPRPSNPGFRGRGERWSTRGGRFPKPGAALDQVLVAGGQSPERCRSPRGPTCVAALVGSPILLPPRPAEGGIAPPLDDTIRYALLVELAIRRAGPRPTNFPRLAGGPPLTACWKFVNVTYCVRLSER